MTSRVTFQCRSIREPPLFTASGSQINHPFFWIDGFSITGATLRASSICSPFPPLYTKSAIFNFCFGRAYIKSLLHSLSSKISLAGTTSDKVVYGATTAIAYRLNRSKPGVFIWEANVGSAAILSPWSNSYTRLEAFSVENSLLKWDMHSDGNLVLSLETCPEIHLITRDILLKRNLADPEIVQVSNWEVPGVVNRAPLSGMKIFFQGSIVCMLAGFLMLRKAEDREARCRFFCFL